MQLRGAQDAALSSFAARRGAARMILEPEKLPSEAKNLKNSRQLEAKNLKSVHTSLWIELTVDCPDHICRELVDLWLEVPLKAEAHISVVLVEVVLELVVGHLVSRLELPIVWTFLLDCIVCQMDVPVTKVALQLRMVRCHQLPLYMVVCNFTMQGRF